MKPKILLIGKNGQVGAELNLLLPQIGEVTTLDRNQLDLARPDEIRRVIGLVRPELIVNAAAYTAVDHAESDQTAASSINTVAPAIMAVEGKRIGATLVHYSTDYVFDGTKNSPYTEEDQPNPINMYGRTKLDGERAIQDTGVSHLIFRTAWVYSQQGRNFLLTILRLVSQLEELRIVSDQKGAPTWSREIAKATTQVLKRLFVSEDLQNSMQSAGGIYHMTASGETTWFHFAEAIIEELRHTSRGGAWLSAAMGGRPLVTRRVIPISSSEYPTAASRPHYSVLSNERLARTFDVKLPDWRLQLRSVFADPAL